MGNQYSYPEAKANQTKLKSQVESVASHMQNLQGVITNFMSAEEFNGETGRQMKAFMGEVVMGAMEASNLLIENVERQYETMVNRFQGIDGADDAIIYDSRLDSAIHENDAYAKTLLNKANEMNRLIQQANGLGVSAKPYNTGEVGQYQNIANAKIQELREKLTSEGNKADEASSLDQFINGVRQFVSYLGSCQPSTYNSGALAGEPFYTSYSSNAIKILIDKPDEYYTSKKINVLSSLEKAAYMGKITSYLVDPRNTVKDASGKVHSPKFNSLLVSATDNETVLDLAGLMTLMSAQARVSYMENPDSEQGKQLAKQAKIFAGIAGILSVTANSMTTAQISEEPISRNTEALKIGKVENPFDISYKDEGAICNFEFTFNLFQPKNEIVIDGSGYRTTSSKEIATMTYSLDSGVGSTDSFNKLADSIKSTDESVISDMLTNIGIDKTTAVGLSQVGRLLGKEVPFLSDAIGVANTSKDLQDNLKEVRILNSKAKAVRISDAMSKFKMSGGQIQVAGEYYMSVSPTEKTVTMINRYNQITGEHITFDDLVDENKLGKMQGNISKMEVVKGDVIDIYGALLDSNSEINY